MCTFYFVTMLFIIAFRTYIIYHRYKTLLRILSSFFIFRTYVIYHGYKTDGHKSLKVGIFRTHVVHYRYKTISPSLVQVSSFVPMWFIIGTKHCACLDSSICVSYPCCLLQVQNVVRCTFVCVFVSYPCCLLQVQNLKYFIPMFCNY